MTDDTPGEHLPTRHEFRADLHDRPYCRLTTRNPTDCPNCDHNHDHDHD